MWGAEHGNTNSPAIEIENGVIQTIERQSKDSDGRSDYHNNMVFNVEWDIARHPENRPRDEAESPRFCTHTKEICEGNGYVQSNSFFGRIASGDLLQACIEEQILPIRVDMPPRPENIQTPPHNSNATFGHRNIRTADASAQARSEGGPSSPANDTPLESQLTREGARGAGGGLPSGAEARGAGNPGFPDNLSCADNSLEKAGRKLFRILPYLDFDQSPSETVKCGENDGRVATRKTAPSCRLFDIERDHPVAFKGEEDSSKRPEEPEPPRVHPRPKRGSRRKAPVSYAPVPPKTQRVIQPPKGRQIRPPPFRWGPTLEGSETRMIREPETRPIGPEQLIAEAKGIYAGIVLVEAKCAEMDAKLAAPTSDEGGTHLDDQQWQALVALHCTLLNEHHDFFLASQHPSASLDLRRLASKHAMPARMWKYGIHNFLELLRHRLASSLEHMLRFICFAYSMMALLYETVPAFGDTWIECLGDLARYRMVIERNDIRDRGVWAGVSRFWYSKATDQTPYVGRLFHHLAILGRPSVLQQLFYYCKSLAVTQPFYLARESILTLFDPIFLPEHANRNSHVDSGFVRLHAINFTHIDLEMFGNALSDYLDNLDQNIGRIGPDWKVSGAYIAICNITGLFQYGAKQSLLRSALRQGSNQPIPEEDMGDAPAAALDENPVESDSLLPPLPTGASSEHVTSMLQPPSKLQEDGRYSPNENSELGSQATGNNAGSRNGVVESLSFAKRLAYETLSVALQRVDDSNVLPHVHIWLVFLAYAVKSEPVIRLLETEFPWEHLVSMLNSLVGQSNENRFGCKDFPVPEKGRGRPLPEDYTLRGLEWAQEYFPNHWFEDAQLGDEERLVEVPPMENVRVERVLWLATQVASNDECLVYTDKTFRVHPALETRVEGQQRQEVDIAHEEEVRGSRMTPTLEDSGVGVANREGGLEDGDYVLVGLSEEVNFLR